MKRSEIAAARLRVALADDPTTLPKAVQDAAKLSLADGESQVEYSDRAKELAVELRAKAQRNLELLEAGKSCAECGFELWNPIPASELKVTNLSLYDDARFPGRCILRLRQHEERLEQLDSVTATAFMADIQRAVRALSTATGSERVNVAILGNAVPHLHAHLIPRYPKQEAKPMNSPWDDPRPKATLPETEKQRLMSEIELALGADRA